MTVDTEADDLGRKVSGIRYLERFGPLFASLHSCGTVSHKARNRDLHFDQYASLILLYFFSPALTSLRGLQQVTAVEKVRRATGCGRTSLGSLSEAPSAFDPELLRPILADLAEKAVPVVTGKEAEALRGLTAVDGTFSQALPRMVWALWRDGGKGIEAHVHFDVLKAVPEDVTVTAAASPEVAQMEGTLKPNRPYVTDRGYACYRLFGKILGAGSSFIGRVKANTAFAVREEREPTEEARRAGVGRDAVVGRRGADHHRDDLGRAVRLVWVRTGKVGEGGGPEVLLPCTGRLDLEAELVTLGYEYRWWVELFFRWPKSILDCCHLPSEKPEGVAIQVYLALIASILVSLWTGAKPTKRIHERLCPYFQGVVSEQELDRYLADLSRPRKRKPSRYRSYSS